MNIQPISLNTDFKRYQFDRSVNFYGNKNGAKKIIRKKPKFGSIMDGIFSFIDGLISILDSFRPEPNSKILSHKDAMQKDCRSLAGDWKRVGGDMWAVLRS